MTGLVSSIIQESLTVTFGLDIKPSHFKSDQRKGMIFTKWLKKAHKQLPRAALSTRRSTVGTRVMWCSIKRSSFQLNHFFFVFRSSSLFLSTSLVACLWRTEWCFVCFLRRPNEWMDCVRARARDRRGVFKCTNMYRLSASLWQINKITANDTCWIYEVPFSLNAQPLSHGWPMEPCQIYTHIYYTRMENRDHPRSCTKWTTNSEWGIH